MSLFVQGIKGFSRRWKQSLIATLMFLAILISLVISSLIMNSCSVYKAKNENPYSDYYRLLIDRKVVFSDLGYVSYDKMYSGSWYRIQELNEYFYDIIDYTAEVFGNTTANINPYLPEWLDDSGYFLLYGLTDCMELTEFSRGELTLVDGRYINANDRYENKRVCMINEDIAVINGITVGDKIELKMKDGINDEYTIVGIYRDNIVRSTLDVAISYDLSQNRIFVPLNTFERAYGIGCYNYQIKLSDDSLIDDIERYINEFGMCDGYPAYFIRVADLFESSNQSVHALEDSLLISQYVFVFVSLILVIIFIKSIVNTRKREFGVYLALGKNKCEIIAIQLIELGIPLLISVLVTVILTIWFGSDISSYILLETLENTSAEFLKATTSDTVQMQMFEKDVLYSFTQNDFVFRSLGEAFVVFSPIAIIAVLLSIFEIFKIKVINLLTKQEDL